MSDAEEAGFTAALAEAGLGIAADRRAAMMAAYRRVRCWSAILSRYEVPSSTEPCDGSRGVGPCPERSGI